MAIVRLAAVSILLLSTGVLAGEPVTRVAVADTRVAPATVVDETTDMVLAVAMADTLPPRLTDKDRSRLEKVVQDLRRGNVPQAEERWLRVVRETSTGAAPVDVEKMLHWVLRETYVENNKDLRFYADKVRYYNDQKQMVRDHLAEIRATAAETPRNTKIEVERIELTKSYKPKKEPVQTRSTKKMKDQELASYMKEWEDKLATIGDDAQLANIDLQNQLQKQQQTLQTMSNVSKMLHDTAMAVIRKIG